MKKQIKIAILGAFNYTYNTHHAVNFALNHAIDFLDIQCDYYWIKYNQFSELTEQQKDEFNGFWLGPKPFLFPDLIHPIIQELLAKNKTVLITDEAFKQFIETIAFTYNISNTQQKIISENTLHENSIFERLELTPISSALQQLYENFDNQELTSSKYSIYPQFVDQIKQEVLDIDAVNQFNEPIVFSLKNQKFFVATSFCPQISSTIDKPHPIIYTFLKATCLKK